MFDNKKIKDLEHTLEIEKNCSMHWLKKCIEKDKIITDENTSKLYWLEQYNKILARNKELETKLKEKENEDIKIKMVTINRIPYKIIYKNEQELKNKIETIIDLTLKGEEI